MATREKRVAFLWRRFKGFWNQYRQTKRGMVGIIIIFFFAVVAVFAPILSPLDPLAPRMEGYYIHQQPKLCEKLCVPIWYKTILGMNDLSENFLTFDDHEYMTADSFTSQIEWHVLDSGYDVDVQYNPSAGTHDESGTRVDGCIEITYTRDATETPPSDGAVSVVLRREFEWPYGDPPRSFWWHYSLNVQNRTSMPVIPLSIGVQIQRGDEPQPTEVLTGSKTHVQKITSAVIGNIWGGNTDSTTEVDGIEAIIFTGRGEYAWEFVINIYDSEVGAKDITVLVDNTQAILYGNTFGLLGTSAIPKPTPRDLFTMLLYGTRISFMIGLLTAVFSVMIGLFVGLVAGYVRGLVDEGLMRFADFLMVLPGLPLLIVLVTVLGRSIWNIIGVLIFMGWMGFSRSVRSMVLSLRERPFIESAKASGAGIGYIIYRHILPNVFALVYISLATSVPGAIISEASLAWLGLGDVNIPSWGLMLYDFSRTETAVVTGLGQYWFWVVPPGIAIALMALAFILMGFSLDEILNPRLRQRR
ncbi:MAG: ABC transporter permease [Candidatus Bathyarchaeota archaeon]|nr:MAG: ABC transporter permease [Candidatus Bathyarchaeota archaeon]